MKYMIAKSSTSEALEKKVNKLMKEQGWEPLGAHAVVTWPGYNGVREFEYSQVLINQGSR